MNILIKFCRPYDWLFIGKIEESSLYRGAEMGVFLDEFERDFTDVFERVFTDEFERVFKDEFERIFIGES